MPDIAATADALPVQPGRPTVHFRGIGDDYAGPNDKTETIPTPFFSAGNQFWKAVGKYGIAVPVMVYLIWWGCNGVSRVVVWTGDKVIDPVVKGHTSFLEKTVANQETGNKALGIIGEGFKAFAEEQKKTRRAIEKLGVKSEVSARPGDDEQGAVDAIEAAPGIDK